MSKIARKNKYKLEHAIDSIKKDKVLNEAAPGKYPPGAKKYQKRFIDYLESIDSPTKTAADEFIIPGGKSGGYRYEGLLKSSLEKERQSRVPAGSKEGMATLDSPTLKFDLSLSVASMVDGGLRFEVDTDKTGKNNPNRVINAEVKMLPAQFGQFKKGQVATLEFDGSKINWTHHSDTIQGERARIDNLLNNLNAPETKIWFVEFLAWCNEQMKTVHEVLEKGFEEFVAKNDTRAGEFRIRKTAPTSVVRTDEASLQLNPFIGNLDKINLLKSIYEQLGAAYNFNGFKISETDENSTRSSGRAPVASLGQKMTQLPLDFSHYSLKGSLLQEKPEQLELPFDNKPLRRDDEGKLEKQQGIGHVSSLNKLVASESVGPKIAHFALKGGDTTQTGFRTFTGAKKTTGPGGFDYSGTAWRDYMAQVKDIVIFGTAGETTVRGKVYALHHNIPATAKFDLFDFPNDVKVSSRFEHGNFRMETQASLKNETLPSNGHLYNNAEELYDILVGWDHYNSQRYSDGDQINRTANPKDPDMGSGSYRGLDKDGIPLMANRKRKYSLTARLLK